MFCRYEFDSVPSNSFAFYSNSLVISSRLGSWMFLLCVFLSVGFHGTLSSSLLSFSSYFSRLFHSFTYFLSFSSSLSFISTVFPLLSFFFPLELPLVPFIPQPRLMSTSKTHQKRKKWNRNEFLYGLWLKIISRNAPGQLEWTHLVYVVCVRASELCAQMR